MLFVYTTLYKTIDKTAFMCYTKYVVLCYNLNVHLLVDQTQRTAY